MLQKRLIALLGLLVISSLILSACGGAAAPTTAPAAGGEEPAPAAEEPVAAGGPIAADGLVACQPLPELGYEPSAAVASTYVGVAPEAAPASGASALQGTVYRVGIFSDITTMNYWSANGPDNTVWNSYVQSPLYPSAYGLADKSLQFVPSVAASEPFPPPALVQEGDFWVVEIPFRTDATWSDGTPLTAADWAFTANTALRFGLIAGGWSTWYDANFLDRIEAVDDYTAKLFYHTRPGTFRHEFGTLLAPILNAAFWGPLVDAAAAPLEGVDTADEEALVAAQAEAQNNLYAIVPTGEPYAGSFVFTARQEGASIESTARTDNFDRGTVVTIYVDGTYQEVQAGDVFQAYGEGTGDVDAEWTVGPNVVSVLYSVYSSQDAALLALRAGEIDFLLNPLGLQRGLLSQVEGDPNLTVIQNNVNGFRYMTFNTRRQPMNFCSFRQAVSVLIDKEFVTGTILQGIAFPLYSYVPLANAAWYFDDVPKLGQGLTREQRVNLAIAILEQDGFSWEGGVTPFWDADNLQVTTGGALIMPNGEPVPALTIMAPSPAYDPLRSTFAVWIETWLNEFGIPVEANLLGFNTIVPLMFTEHNFDMAILGWSLGITPDFLRDFFHSEQAVTDGNNAGGYSNPDFDAAAEAITTCLDLAECKEISDNLQLILATEAPYVLLFDTGIIEVYNNTTTEFPFTFLLSGLQYISGAPATVTIK
ncbi:MAG: ABC transporter substrate-binding protein [Anaerolineales bacterium]